MIVIVLVYSDDRNDRRGIKIIEWMIGDREWEREGETDGQTIATILRNVAVKNNAIYKVSGMSGKPGESLQSIQPCGARFTPRILRLTGV